MQLTLSSSAFLALVASALALQVTSPADGSAIDLSKENKITWSSVSTDPSKFNIVLTNMDVNPSVRIPIASDVEASEGSYELSGVSGATPGKNYRINLESTTANNQGILAQSGQFAVSAEGSDSTTSASFSSSTPSTSAMATTSTMVMTMSSDGSMITMTSTGTSTLTGEDSESTNAPGSSDTPDSSDSPDSPDSPDSTTSDSPSATASETASESESDSSSATGTTTSARGSASAAESSSTPIPGNGASSLNTFAGAGLLAMVAALCA